MQQDVGIAERPEVGKQGRDESIKQFSIQSLYIPFSIIHVLWRRHL